MTKITVCFYDYSRDDEYASSTHSYTHIAAIIEDESKQENTVIINFAGEGSSPPLVTPASVEALEARDKIVLYSDKDISAFKRKFEKKFILSEYGTYYNNCADAVNYALDYFFPDARSAQCSFNFLKFLCCLPAILCCGYMCVPAPLLINTPIEVFLKARSIEKLMNKKDHLKKIGSANVVAFFSAKHSVVKEKQATPTKAHRQLP